MLVDKLQNCTQLWVFDFQDTWMSSKGIDFILEEFNYRKCNIMQLNFDHNQTNQLKISKLRPIV